MMRILLFACFALASLASVRAIICWECDTEPTNAECIRVGKMTACLSNQNMCQNEARTVRGGGFEISKRCKQSHACDNNVGQNAQSFQCSSRFPKAICRCCCATNLCNEPFLECHPDPPIPQPECRLIGVPRFGRRDCTPGSDVDRRGRTARLGVECRFSCREGYLLLGSDASVCTRSLFGNRARFDKATPRCAALVCDPARTNPRNGAVSCTNGNSIRSVCSYTCQAGFSLIGSSSTRCGLNNRWSEPEPKCERIRCLPAHVNPRRGSVSCTDRNYLNSVCTFTCNRGYLLEGRDVSECEDDNSGDAIGRWTERPPTCTRIRCNPPHINPANGNVDCTDANEEGSVCSFECNGGFFLAGSDESICEDDEDNDDDGVWSEDPPTCTRITCNPEQTAPVNGGVACTSGNSFGSVCRFTCDPGFFRNGARSTRCEDDNNGDAEGVWSESPPVCQRITCQPMQTNPRNGDVNCDNANNLGSICRFACQEGFAVDGVRLLTCRDDGDNDDDGEWSDDPPTCAPVSCNPRHQNPANGDVACDNDNNFASVCRFTCDGGYFLRGSRMSVCEDDRDGDTDGVWSTDAPTCVRIRCRPAFSNPTNGLVDCTNANNEGSICSFTCIAGYFLNGEDESTCVDDGDNDADGEWTSPAPRCRRVLCLPAHRNPRFGNVDCTNTNNEGSLCTFTCNNNFFLAGEPTSLCEDDLNGDEEGLWNNEAPTCIRVVCNPARTNPTNGNVICSNSNNAGSRCRYACDEGYFLDTSEGASSTICRDDNDDDELGEWTDPPPSCTRITCVPAHTDPANGDVDCSNRNNFGSVCEFTCDAGFFLSGSSDSACVEDDNLGDEFGMWSSVAPTCVRIRCRPAHTDPTNGMVDCTNRNFVNSVCTFTCNDGFFLDGSSMSTCNDDMNNDADGVWSSEAPTCGRITCRPRFLNPRNGQTTCTNENLVGSVCSFECDEGFFLNGPESSECRDDDGLDAVGVWSNTELPVCARIICNPARTNPSNGDVDCTDLNREDSVCTYTCNPGYFLEGSDSTTCVDDANGDRFGVWTEPPPVCIRVICNPPHQNPQNGAVRCSDENNEGSECDFTCDAGFFLDGSDVSVCNDDMNGDELGEWSADAPTCVRIRCPPPHRNPVNGAVDCTDRNFYLSECTFVCNNGFFLDGSSLSTCEDDEDDDALGEWSTDAPTCVLITCTPEQSNPTNGNVNCDNRNNVFSECSFTCDDGFFLDGSPTVTCNDDNDNDALGVWSSAPPTCGRITCRPPFLDITNGETFCTDVNFIESVCSFRCDEGFFLNGPESSECLDDDGLDAIGVWSNPDAPFCARIVCNPARSNPNNGAVDCTDRNLEDSVCTYTCNAGYFLEGSDSTTCVDDANGDRFGVWTEPPPVCIRVICNPPHQNPGNGSVRCSDENNEGSECDFTCDAGFFLDGSDVSVCNDDMNGDQLGEWSADAPTCVRIRCPPPHRDPVNGIVDCTDRNFYLSECTFACNDLFFLDGAVRSICEDDEDDDALGEWSTDAPTCVAITCLPEQTDPDFGNVQCSNFNFLLSECSFTCLDGFFLNGSPQTQCIDDFDQDALGVWDATPPECQQIRCNPPHTDPTDGNVDCTNSNIYNSVCTFSCMEGFFLNGEEESTCVDLDENDALGEWSSPAPTCSRIICLPPHEEPENGDVDCTNQNNENSECTFTCNVGFFLVGEEVSLCLDDNNGDAFGQWTSDAPVCTQIRCVPRQEAPENGEVDCSNDNLAGSVCSFDCDDDYFRQGAESTTCVADIARNAGDWSREAPVCIRVTCQPEFTELEDGFIDCTDANFARSRCNFECDIGFALVGSASSLCVDDNDNDEFGEWTNQLPQCQRITCQPPYTEIANGMVECTDSNFHGSLCTFTCDGDDFDLLGSPESDCVETEPVTPRGQWTFPPPTCNRRTCGDPPPAPENGFITCTDESFLGSECEYSCRDYHTREGPLITTCVEGPDGRLFWDNFAPECQPNVCDPQEIDNGRVVCTTTSLIAPTTCEFICNDNFNILPPELANNMCMNNSEWSSPPPCCAQLCPPFALIDLAVILDASTSPAQLNWDSMLAFVGNLTETFLLGPEMTQMAVFRYNRTIDRTNQIFLNTYTSDDVEDFQNAINAMQFDMTGNGTRTGLALRHARNVIFTARNGDRPNVQNVVLLLTDGLSQDEVAAAAQALRADGTLIYVVGILPPFGILNQDELVEIAGDPERVVVAIEGFDSLDEQFAALLGDELCPRPCQ